MPTYVSPKLTDLGQVEDLTQLTITIKSSRPGTDVHVSRSGVTTTNDKRGLTVSI